MIPSVFVYFENFILNLVSQVLCINTMSCALHPMFMSCALFQVRLFISKISY